MFVRKKKNKSGTISVVVIDKSHGGFKEVKNFGVVSSEAEADALCVHAHEWLRPHSRRDTQTSCHSQDMSANEQDGHGGLP